MREKIGLHQPSKLIHMSFIQLKPKQSGNGKLMSIVFKAAECFTGMRWRWYIGGVFNRNNRCTVAMSWHRLTSMHWRADCCIITSTAILRHVWTDFKNTRLDPKMYYQVSRLVHFMLIKPKILTVPRSQTHNEATGLTERPLSHAKKIQNLPSHHRPDV